eukprot:tig00020553_g10652.t1
MSLSQVSQNAIRAVPEKLPPGTSTAPRQYGGGFELSVFLKNDNRFKDFSDYGYQVEKTFHLNGNGTSLWMAAREVGGEEGLTLHFELRQKL